MPGNDGKFDANALCDAIMGDISDKLLQNILQNLVDNSSKFAGSLVGNEYKIEVDIDKNALTGSLTAVGSKAIEIENKNGIFQKTFEYITTKTTMERCIGAKIEVDSKYRT